MSGVLSDSLTTWTTPSWLTHRGVRNGIQVKELGTGETGGFELFDRITLVHRQVPARIQHLDIRQPVREG